MMASHEIRTTRKGIGITAPASANKSKRVFPESLARYLLPWLEAALRLVPRRQFQNIIIER